MSSVILKFPKQNCYCTCCFSPCFMPLNFIRSCQYFTNTCERFDNNPDKATFLIYTIHHITRVVRKVSSHFEYIENRSRGLDVTWQPVRGDLTVYP